MRRLAATTLVVLALTGSAACGGGNDSGSGSGETSTESVITTTPKFPRSGLQTYETPDEIVADLNSGLTCSNYRRSTSGSVNAASSGSCDLELESGSTEEILLMIFSSETNKENQAGVYRELGSIIKEYGFVEGGNWMINCGRRNLCESIAGVLGGRTETLPLT